MSSLRVEGAGHCAVLLGSSQWDQCETWRRSELHTVSEELDAALQCSPEYNKMTPQVSVFTGPWEHRRTGLTTGGKYSSIPLHSPLQAEAELV